MKMHLKVLMAFYSHKKSIDIHKIAFGQVSGLRVDNTYILDVKLVMSFLKC